MAYPLTALKEHFIHSQTIGNVVNFIFFLLLILYLFIIQSDCAEVQD